VKRKKCLLASFFVICIFVLYSCEVNEENKKTDDPTQETVQKTDSLDQLEIKIGQERAKQLLLHTFNLWNLSQTDSAQQIQWVDWENIFFSQEYFRQRLLDFIKIDWSEGIWWWQISVYIDVPELKNFKRGNEFKFVIDYPLVDWRDDLVISIKKNNQGETIAYIAEGSYFTPRHSYIVSFIIMLLSLVVFILVVGLVVYLLYIGFMKMVNNLADYMTQGQGNNIWAQRFAASLIGSFILFAIGVLSLVFS